MYTNFRFPPVEQVSAGDSFAPHLFCQLFSNGKCGVNIGYVWLYVIVAFSGTMRKSVISLPALHIRAQMKIAAYFRRGLGLSDIAPNCSPIVDLIRF